MRKKKSATKDTAPIPRHRSTDDQVNALEQERLRSTVSDLLIRSLAELKRELAAVTERNRQRFDRFRDHASSVPEAERTALLITLHTDVEQMLAVYWFFVTSGSFPPLTSSPSVRDPAFVSETLEPFREFLFE